MRRWTGMLVLLWLWPALSAAQGASTEADSFSRLNSWTVLAEYSNTSSHILMGVARQRELVTLGAAYTRRVVRFRGMALGYRAELRPLVFESDPLVIENYTEAVVGVAPLSGTMSFVNSGKCVAGTSEMVYPPQPGFPGATVNLEYRCGRQWTYAQSFSPLGFKYSFDVAHRVQPYVVGTLGYMYSSRPIPVSEAEAFNFAFDFGAGIEVYRGRRRSIALETRFHHFSNRDTAPSNPGVDNLMYGVSYSFGR